MNKKLENEILESINDRVDILEAVMVSVSDIATRNKVEGKLKALKLLKQEINLLELNPCELTAKINERFQNQELGIKGKYIREGFESVLNEYKEQCRI